MRERSFLWSRLFVIGLVASTAVLTVAGIAAHYFDLGATWDARLNAVCAAAFAGIAGFSLGNSQMAAAMAETLRNRPGQAVPFWMAVANSVVCGLISLGGVHLGALTLGLDPILLDAAGLVLCGVKPTMTFVTEAARSASRAEVRAEEASEERHAREAAALRETINDLRAQLERARREVQQPLPAGVADLGKHRAAKKKPAPARTIAKAAAATAAAVTGAGAMSAAAEPAAIVQAEQEWPPVRLGYTPALVEVEAARAWLTARGMTTGRANLARRLGCTEKAVRRAIGDPHA